MKNSRNGNNYYEIKETIVRKEKQLLLSFILKVWQQEKKKNQMGRKVN